MLGVHGVARAGADYYLSDLGQELPVGRGPCWTGVAAAGLGLEGEVDAPGLRLLLEGRHPLTGADMRSGRVRVAGWDLAFSAPKSVGVLFALGGPDMAAAVVAAHDEAVSGALIYLEHHGVTAVRRRGPESVVLPTSGLVAARVTHAVNRNEDPHLHTHVVMANLVHGSDGAWGACDRRGIEAHRAAADASYLAHLRAGLVSATGVRWAGGPERAPEILGVPPALLGEFASRSADIRRHRHEFGSRSTRGARVAWAATRAAKGPGRDYADLAAEWARRARAVGVDTLDLPGRSGPTARRLDEHRFAASVWLTPHGGVRRRDAVAAFAGAALDGISANALAQLVDHWVPTGSVGVAEPLRPRGAVVPPGYLLHALGPRPLDPGDHEVWVGAAREVEAYRARWGLGASVQPLALMSPPLVSPARLADHLRTTRRVEVARARLERRAPRSAPEVERGLVR